MLQLYKTYSKNEAVQLFNSRICKELSFGDFIALDNEILCFSELDTRNIFDTPSDFLYIPNKLLKNLEGKYAWLPTEVREARNYKKKLYLFVKKIAQESYVYIGEVFLTSYRHSNNFEECNAHFSLSTKLRQAIWLTLGRYKNWCITFNHKEYFLEFDDIHSLEKLYKDFALSESLHIELTRYEEDVLSLNLNSKNAWLMYLREPGDSGLYLKRGDEEDYTIEEFSCSCGITLGVPTYQIVSRNEGLSILKDFFKTGNLPTQYNWSEEY